METPLDRSAALTRPHFLNGGGDIGARMRAHDWSRSPLGDPQTWPQSLRTVTTMMLNTLQPMFIAWGPDLAFLYNDPYAPVLGARHPEALGRPFEDVWSDIWPDLEPLIRSALSGAAVWQDDLPLLMHRHGYPEQTYFTFTYSPLYDEAGKVGGMYCTCIETTQQVVAERNLRETAEALARSRESYRRQGERLFSLFEEAPGFVAVVEGPDHVFTLANGAYRQLIGHRDVVGLPVRAALPEVEGTGLFEILDAIYAGGEAYHGASLQVALQRTPGAPPEPRFVDFIYQPIREENGTISGIFVQGSDVTERARFVDQQQLLLNELNHRVKNNLATVQSLAAQTARRAPDIETFIKDFEGRLVALSRTHDVLTQNAWVGADLKILMARELDVFGDRVRLAGPPVQLDSTQALAVGLIVHELATNAAKYGALKVEEGHVEIHWTADDGRLSLAWSEHGGPPVVAPSRRGFGSRLITRLATGDLRGSVDSAYPPDGFRLNLSAPLQPR